jgi:DNA-binding MarR family transcriptional regulator
MDIKKIRSVVKSPYTFSILSKIYHGYRPSQIAKQLRISSQSLHYHMDRMTDLRLIEKVGDKKEIAWKITERGLLILKESLSRSVKSGNNIPGHIPVRIHCYTVEFRIKSIPEKLNCLDWKPMNNGIFKLTLRYADHIEELIKSPNEWASALLVHVPEEYSLDPINGTIKLYSDACDYANKTAQRLNIEISSRAKVIGKPHFAFEDDMIALYLATFQTSEITTAEKKGKAWIDASQGFGELETNDINYAYKYLTMPENTFKIYEDTAIIKRILSGYEKCYHPLSTVNN